MKKNKTLIKELRQDLHYHQMMVRVDLNAARAGTRKCKEIGAKMRALQDRQAVEQMRAADFGYECRCNAEHAHMTYIAHEEGCPARLHR